ncbi:hypothetical protein [Breznakia pachnodae]|uniref:Maturase K n=1 Tax=Breznakia pachnodae TaxID=265178 RepID=A0ABU0DXT7_9FIRM|nr:hypothetical protein [Breznakia pachnodae]MDQ0359457.1 hypothetical protein [Breznakia pachnodae]
MDTINIDIPMKRAVLFEEFIEELFIYYDLEIDYNYNDWYKKKGLTLR